MRVSVALRHGLLISLCGMFAVGCDQFPLHSDRAAQASRHTKARIAAPAKPVGSPATQKTCKETFRLEPGDPRYDRCIASLTELETKP